MLDERRSDNRPPTINRIMQPQEMRAYVRDNGGHSMVRPIRSFIRQQGVRADGTPKFRRIEDCKEGGQNGAASTCETVFHVSFEWPALAARLLLEVAD